MDLTDPQKLVPERFIAVREAKNHLNQALNSLKSRLKSYCTIDSFAQSNFHPFFYLLSRINAHEAKLYIFFSAYIDKPSSDRNGSRHETLLHPIRLFEKARIYAARDGKADYYAYWSAYQSFCYLILAYLGEFEQPMQGFNRRDCIEWANSLMNHALVCYSPTGKKCYQEIKDHGGKITSNYRTSTEYKKPNYQQNAYKKYYENYGYVKVQVIPLIRESNNALQNNAPDFAKQVYEPVHNVLNLDMSILRQTSPYFRATSEPQLDTDLYLDTNQQKMVYLFGTHSAILLFAMGMLDLCSTHSNEKTAREKVKEALRKFTYCWATAEDGTTYDKENQELFLDRDFLSGVSEDSLYDNFNDSLIQGLYPHRLTDFADLGKVFAVSCLVILFLNESNKLDPNPIGWKNIEALINKLHNPSKSQNILGQKRYNGHLAIQFANLQTYFAQLKNRVNVGKTIEIQQIRDKIVKDVFRIIRGESDIKP